MTAQEIGTRAFYMASADQPLIAAYARSRGINIATDGLRASMADVVDFAETLSADELGRHREWIENATEMGA